MINLLEIEKNFLIPHIKKGGVAVDFTMGNGHDTLWLSEAMGENGKVYAFDIQPQALESSRKLLEENGAAPNYTLILDSHSNVMDYVHEKICIGMFNLGFLPGGDKSITTKRDTTMIAIRAAIDLLDADGALLIVDLNAVQIGRCPLGAFDGLLLIHAVEVETDHHGAICVHQFCQHLV